MTSIRVTYKGRPYAVKTATPCNVLSLKDFKVAVGNAIGLSPHRVELRSTDPSKDKEAKGKDPSFTAKRFEGLLKTLSQVGIASGTEVFVKDLGSQIGYRTVFFIEYAGPIFIVCLALLRGALPFLGPFFFGEARPLDVAAALSSANFAKPEGSKEWAAFAQALAVAMWLAHFVKRELESAFVHKFSHPTMPLSQLFKNSTYYWGFACAVAFPLVHPLYQAPGKTQVAVGFALWVACQLVNLAVHLQLAGMRGSDLDDSRKPPHGPLFSLVTSPNYTSEVLGWVAWSVASNIFMGYVFTLVGFAQMAQWALQKYRGYLKDEPDGKAYAKARKSIVPFLL